LKLPGRRIEFSLYAFCTEKVTVTPRKSDFVPNSKVATRHGFKNTVKKVGRLDQKGPKDISVVGVLRSGFAAPHVSVVRGNRGRLRRGPSQPLFQRFGLIAR
jgi:hypothetical protein